MYAIAIVVITHVVVFVKCGMPVVGGACSGVMLFDLFGKA